MTSDDESSAIEQSATEVAASEPEDTSAILAHIAERLEAAKRVLITCHRGPDGDSVSTMIALASLLRTHGTAVVLYNPDPVPRRLKWLPLTGGFNRKLTKKRIFDCTVVIDCADTRMLGQILPPPEVTGTIIVLDHHASGSRYGDIYLCDSRAASCGVLVARLAAVLGWSLTQNAALGIYVSMCSDTGTFRYANTNAEALRLGAELLQSGIDPWLVSERLYERQSLTRYKLLARLLDNIEMALDGQVAIFVLTRDVLKEAGASWEDSVGLVDYTRGLAGVECGLLLSPAKRGGIRVSMRSKGDKVDAGALCATMGGGGHRGAAGCVVEGDLESARTHVLQVLAKALAD